MTPVPALVLALVIGFVQAIPDSSASLLAGRWRSAITVQPGEAPAIEPSFELVTKEGKVEIAFGSRPSVEAQAYSAGRGKLPLVIVRDVPALRGSRLVILRPVSVDEVHVELFNDAGSGERGRFYYSEVFKRVK